MKAVFDSSFFNDEIRDGFNVPSLMKRNWAVQIDILCMVDEICKKNDIPYWVDFGTLLGTIRHKGFIPWDDDIDISMKRLDYERFKKVVYDEIREPYRVSYLVGNASTPLKILNRGNIGIDGIAFDFMHGFPYITGIDIFPYDNVPSDDDYSIMKKLITCTLEASKFWGTGEVIKMSENEKLEALKVIEEATGIPIDHNKDIQKQMHYLCDKISAMYFDKPSNEMAYMIEYALLNKSCYPKEWLEDFVYMPFENISVPVPRKYEKMLELYFGDWKKPVMNDAGHNYPFFKDQIELLKKKADEDNYLLDKIYLWEE